MTDEYITISKAASKEIIINKSRFIGYASPCPTESDALLYIKKIREEHRSATHNCYAYIIGQNSGIIRYSDDGEPGGTAGLPILDVIRSRRIVNCCVVIVRYFGGTLLGTGGLVRAYTQGCKIALEAAQIVRMEKTAHYLCDIPYSFWDSVRHAAESLPVRILDPEFGASVTFTLAVRIRDAAEALEAMARVTSRKMEAVPAEESFEPWEI